MFLAALSVDAFRSSRVTPNSFNVIAIERDDSGSPLNLACQAFPMHFSYVFFYAILVLYTCFVNEEKENLS